MVKVYNKQHHLELLRLESSHERPLTSIEKLELNHYSSVLESSVDWETKDQYLELLEEFHSREINLGLFFLGFKERIDWNIKVYDSLKANFCLLSFHEKSMEFSNFIEEIVDLYYEYEQLFDSAISEEESDSHKLQCYKSIEKIYLKIQALLKEE